MVKKGSEHQFIGPEPACSISERAAKWTIREWMHKKHREPWKSIPGQKCAMGFLQELSAKRTKEVLTLNRSHLRHVTGLLTEHCHFKGHLFKLGMGNSPNCERCCNKEETASHAVTLRP
jgi:hypothetical protein